MYHVTTERVALATLGQRTSGINQPTKQPAAKVAAAASAELSTKEFQLVT